MTQHSRLVFSFHHPTVKESAINSHSQSNRYDAMCTRRERLRRSDSGSDHLKIVSNSDIFTPTGCTKIGVIWDLSVKKIDDKTCEFTNMLHSSAMPELIDCLGKQRIPMKAFQAARKPVSAAHNREETPLFAKSIERHALRNK
jgi:hypothetical protein